MRKATVTLLAALAGALAMFVVVFPSMPRLQERALEAVPDDWAVVDVFRDSGEIAVGRRAQVIVTVIPQAPVTQSFPTAACPATSVVLMPGGSEVSCQSLTTDVRAVFVAGNSPRGTVTVYRRATWWAPVILAGLVAGFLPWLLRRV